MMRKSEYFVIPSYPKNKKKFNMFFHCLCQCKIIYHTKYYKESICHLGFTALVTCYPKLAICVYDTRILCAKLPTTIHTSSIGINANN